MNNLRRLAAAILALMMLFALTATAFAESKTAENKAPVSKAPYEELRLCPEQLAGGRSQRHQRPHRERARQLCRGL